MRRGKKKREQKKKDANLQENLSSIPTLFICPKECRLEIKNKKKNGKEFSQDNLKLLEIDEIA